MTAPATTGLVLAGGGSTRMGTDKLLLTVGGQRLIDRAYAALEPICERVLVAASGRIIPGLELEVVDDAEGAGPLAGILGGLRVASTPLLAVVAGDMPVAKAAVFRRLAAHWHGEAAVVPRADGMLQPLHAVYATAEHDRFQRLLKAGERSPRRAAQALDAAVVDADVYDPAGDAGAFWTNINAPADLARLGAPPAPR